MVCAAGPGRWLWLCRRRPEWKDGAQPDGSAGGAEASGCDHKLCLGQRGRYFRPLSVHRRHVGRHGGDLGASPVTRPHRDGGCLRAGRDGRGLRGYRTRSHDLGGDDLRDDPGLCGHRAADDCEFDEPVHLVTIAAAAYIRSPGRAGWHTPADGRDAPPAWSAAGDPSHAHCGRVVAQRYDRWGSPSGCVPANSEHAW